MRNKKKKNNNNYSDILLTTVKITKDVIINEDIKVLENYLKNSAYKEVDSNFFKNGGWEIVDLKIPLSIEHILNDYTRQKQINEEHQKENGLLREKVKELELESKENKKKYLALLIGQFPNTTETYKKYKKQLEELLQDEDK